MNERIKQLLALADQMTLTAIVQTDIKFDSEDFNAIKFEKFAELLIRECMGIISDESEKVSDEWRCKDGKHIWWKIKEHFGVEE